MYILFEKYASNCDGEDIYLYDAIGYTDTEGEAYAWVSKNEECRTYEYCPNNRIVQQS